MTTETKAAPDLSFAALCAAEDAVRETAAIHAAKVTAAMDAISAAEQSWSTATMDAISAAEQSWSEYREAQRLYSLITSGRLATERPPPPPSRDGVPR